MRRSIVASVALAGGVNKSLVPKEKLVSVPGGAWTKDAEVGLVKATGALDLLAAFGLPLPARPTSRRPLVPVTAVGFALLMVGAINVRRRHEGEAKYIAADAALLALAAFVAVGRA
ncbi:DoxX family protein [Actinomadura oligospora]|uniref:DoxX family protein n=1 Tax=Actinomadura oligospora TaxID=111804 RepID=UPI0012F9EB9A|nr:DoxX family protein [Actinomadura oligospora]